MDEHEYVAAVEIYYGPEFKRSGTASANQFGPTVGDRNRNDCTAATLGDSSTFRSPTKTKVFSCMDDVRCCQESYDRPVSLNTW